MEARRVIPFWTAEEIEILTKNWALMSATELGKLINRKPSGIYRMVKILGLKSDPEKAKRLGRKTMNRPEMLAKRFTKGHESYNKGKKMPPEQYAKCAPTMFKKGNTPLNHREVGSERIAVDGYVEIKVAEPNKWMAKHRYIWEQHNGKIPRGTKLSFINGDKTDIRLDNLELRTNAEHLAKSCTVQRYPEEVRNTILLIGALHRQINKKEKKNNGK